MKKIILLCLTIFLKNELAYAFSETPTIDEVSDGDISQKHCQVVQEQREARDLCEEIFSPSNTWKGLPQGENKPKSIEDLRNILQKKNEDYSKRSQSSESLSSEPSHVVCLTSDYAYKFLNLTKGGKSDEEPETEIICACFYEAMGIPELIAKTELIKHEKLGLIQRSPKITMGPEGIQECSETNGQQFIMSLLLGYGDAKKDNFIINEIGKRIAIDTEMAFRSSVRLDPTRGPILGQYCCLYKDENFKQKKIDEKVKKWLKKFSKEKKAEFESLLSLFFSEEKISKEETLSSKLYQKIKERFEDKKRPEEHKCLKMFFNDTDEIGRESLFNKILQFIVTYLRILDIINKNPEITYEKLFMEYDKSLSEAIDKKTHLEEPVLLMQEKDFSLCYVTDHELRWDFYEKLIEQVKLNFLERLNKKNMLVSLLKGLKCEKEGKKKEAVKYYKEIGEKKEKDHNFSHNDALCFLGWCYKKGFGVEKNNKKALECWEKGKKNSFNITARRCHAYLQLNLLKRNGKFKKKDIDDLCKDLEGIANQGATQGDHRVKGEYARICVDLVKLMINPDINSLEKEIDRLREAFENALSAYKQSQNSGDNKSISYGKYSLGYVLQNFLIIEEEFFKKCTEERIKNIFDELKTQILESLKPEFGETILSNIVEELYESSSQLNNLWAKLRLAEARDPKNEKIILPNYEKDEKEAENLYRECRKIGWENDLIKKYWFPEFEKYFFRFDLEDMITLKKFVSAGDKSAEKFYNEKMDELRKDIINQNSKKEKKNAKTLIEKLPGDNDLEIKLKHCIDSQKTSEKNKNSKPVTIKFSEDFNRYKLEKKQLKFLKRCRKLLIRKR